MGLLSTIGAASARAYGFTRSAIASAVDQYFNLVTLLLPGNGTNGAQNNTFLDSSSNNFTITRNGNTTQGTFSPFSQTGWSNYFDGTDDYLAIADNAVLRPGAGAFTLEAWIWRNASGAAHTIYAKGGASTGIVFQVTSTNVLRFTHTTTNIDSTGTISANAWTHVAVVREGTGTNQTKLYINGTQDGQGTVSTDFTQTEEVRIGTNRGATEDYAGYISNLRFTKGSALYTGSFTPSTTPLTTTSQGASSTEVELLTCQDNRFKDNSSNAFSITVTGTPSVQAFSPFAPTAAYSAATNGGSGYFDGTGDCLSLSYDAKLVSGGTTNAFTVDFWYYLSSSFTNGARLLSFSQDGGATGWDLWCDTAGILYMNNGGTSSTTGQRSFGSGSLNKNEWAYIRLVSDGTNFSAYRNGSRIFTVAGGFATVASGNLPTIGARRNSTNTISDPALAYITDVRVVKGGALNSPSDTTITVPTSPLTTSVSAGTCNLLLNFTNAGITDATAKNVLETVGNAQISTTQSKFGGSSMYFDGTGDYITSVANTGLALGSGDFTVEMWLYPTAFASYKTIWGCTSAVNVTTGFHVGANSSGQMFIYSNSAFRISSSANSGVLTLNQWNYLAIVRSSGVVRIYVDGVVATSTWSTTQDFSQGYNVIGAAPGGGSEYFTGYIDDLRITKGVARTVTTSPTSAFALQ